MRKLWMIAFAVLLAINVSACSRDDSPETPEIPKTEQSHNNNNEEDNASNQEKNESMKVTIKIGSSTFTATLTDNETAKTFKAMLPMTINMSELNNNEKFYYLPSNLPTASTNPGTINNGDIMLYGSNCLVLFYKTFSTSYNYTQIGSLDNTSGLENALGTGNVTVIFEDCSIP